MLQLGFPWDAPHLTPVHTDEIDGDTPVGVEVRTGRDVVRLELRAPHGRFDVELHVGAPAGCWVNGQPHWWSLDDDDHADGALGAAVTWALDQLAHPWVTPASWDEAMTRTGRLRARVEASAQVAATLAIAACRPGARARARMFSIEARSFVYGALIADDDGRIAQMTEVCPGLLVLAAPLASAADVVARIHAGEPLAALIAHVTGRRDAAALVRRAPISTARMTLVAALEADGLDVNDVPAAHDERHVWFSWAAAWRLIARRRRDRARVALGGFVSRHALALDARLAELQTDQDTLLGAILDWVAATGAPAPTRRSNPRRVIEAIQDWHDGLAHAGPPLDPATPLALGLPATTTRDGLTVEPLTTAGALADEGRTLRHCVASYAHLGANGAMAFYRATFRGERLTIAIARDGPRWSLAEVAGPANRAATPAARRAIEAWLAA